MQPRFLTAFLIVIAISSTASAADPVKTDVFVSGEEGYHTYRIPSVILTVKKTLLAVCEGRKNNRSDHGNLDLILKRSTDGGKTWGPIELIYEEGGDKNVTIGNPCPVIDRNTGIIWMPFTRDNDDVFMTHSSDDGRTWSKPKNITASVKKPEWGWYATGPGVGIQIQGGKFIGRLVIPCDHRVGEGRDKWNSKGHSHCIYSDDAGKTWKLGEPTSKSMNECQVAELSGGKLMLNMRSYRGKGKRAVSYSSDGGVTWTEPVDHPTLIESVCQASLLVYPEHTDSFRAQLLFSNPASTKSRHKLTVRMSADDGKTWPIARLLHAGPAAYSCLTVFGNGDIGCLYEGGEKQAYEKLIFARFSSEWLKGKE